MSLTFMVKITPNAAKYRWKIDETSTLKCYLTSPAIEGRANGEFIKKLAKLLGIPTSHVQIITGAATRIKKISITTQLTYDQLLEKLNLKSDSNKQINLFYKN